MILLIHVSIEWMWVLHHLHTQTFQLYFKRIISLIFSHHFCTKKFSKPLIAFTYECNLNLFILFFPLTFFMYYLKNTLILMHYDYLLLNKYSFNFCAIAVWRNLSIRRRVNSWPPLYPFTTMVLTKRQNEHVLFVLARSRMQLLPFE